MNPAQLQVSIEADMKALEAQFDGIERAFLAAGQRSAKAFEAQFDGIERAFLSAGQRAAKAFRGEVGMVMSEDVGDKAVAPIARAVSKAVHEGVERATERMRPVGVKMGTAVGRAAAPVLAKEATSFLEREFSDRKLGQIFGQVVGIGMADKAMRSLADAIRGDKTLGEAFADALSSTPVIGAAFDIGRAISDSLWDALGGSGTRDASLQRMIDLDYERNMIAENKAHEEKVALAEQRAKDERKRFADLEKNRVEEIMKTGAVASRLERELVEKNLDFEADYRAANAREAGDENLALQIEMEREIQKERDRIHEQYGMNVSGLLYSQEEKEAQERILKEAENLIRDKYAYKKYLRDQDAKEEKKVSEEALKRESEAMMEQARSLGEERLRAQAVGVGSAGTALGAFRFDAYPEAEKRRNDERMVKGIEELTRKAGGGFT
jgi:hypothetical protein